MDKQVERAMKEYGKARDKLEAMRAQTSKWLAERAKHAARAAELREERLRALMAEDEKRVPAIDKELGSVDHRLRDLDAMIEARTAEAHALALQVWAREGRALATAWHEADSREASEATAEVKRLEPAWIAAVGRWQKATHIAMGESFSYPANAANIRHAAEFADFWTGHIIGRNGDQSEPSFRWLERGTPEDLARQKLDADLDVQNAEQLKKLTAARPEYVSPSYMRQEDAASSIPDVAPVSDEGGGHADFDVLH